MSNHQHKIETLQHRIKTLQDLAQNFSQHKTLLPEILVKTLKDTYRLNYQGISSLNSVQIMEHFRIDCSQEETSLLSEIEHSLRKAKDYYQLSNTYSKEVLLSLAQKLQTYLSSIKN